MKYIKIINFLILLLLVFQFTNLKAGKNILVVAHGNSLRAIVKMLKNISNKNIVKLNIPTGSPYVFEFNEKFELICDEYLGDMYEIIKKAKMVAKQASINP